MSENQSKPGTFVLFKNDYKEEGSKQPDYKSPTKEGKRGKDLDNRDIEVACWVNKSESGVSYMSCTMQYPRPKDEEEKTEEVKETPVEPSDPDLPFQIIGRVG